MAGWLFLMQIFLSILPRVITTSQSGCELLVSTKQRNRLLGLIRREGVTLVPPLYFNDRGLGETSDRVGKGPKERDKRQAERDRDWSRQKQRLAAGTLSETLQMRQHLIKHCKVSLSSAHYSVNNDTELSIERPFGNSAHNYDEMGSHLNVK